MERVKYKYYQPLISNNPLRYIGGSYYRSGRYVYYLGAKIPGAEPKSFVYVGDNYAKDINHVYYNTTLIEQYDPATFEIVGNSFTKDDKKVYYLDNAIYGADPKSFTYVGGDYGRDTINVYDNDAVIRGADPKTFEYIGGRYAKDSMRVYEEADVIHGADFEARLHMSEGTNHLQPIMVRIRCTYIIYRAHFLTPSLRRLGIWGGYIAKMRIMPIIQRLCYQMWSQRRSSGCVPRTQKMHYKYCIMET